MCVCVFVCVRVRERQRGRESKGDGQIDRYTVVLVVAYLQPQGKVLLCMHMNVCECVRVYV